MLAGADNADFFVWNFGYFADFAIVIELFSRGVIAHKHYLCSLFEQKSGHGRVDVFRKISWNFSFEAVFFFYQGLNSAMIDGFSAAVVGG